jgi:hypothetical protein
MYVWVIAMVATSDANEKDVHRCETCGGRDGYGQLFIGLLKIQRRLRLGVVGRAYGRQPKQVTASSWQDNPARLQ